MSKVLEFTDENFDIELENTNNPVIVDFLRHGADTAAAQRPIIEKLADELDGKAIVAKLNVDENREKAAEYFISGIPAILVFKNGKLVEQKAGVRSSRN